MSGQTQNNSQDIFNFENLGDLVRTVGDCIDGKTNIKLDTNLLSNLTRDLTANIQSSVNETIKKHTEHLSNNGEEVPNTVPKESHNSKPDDSGPKATVFTHTSTFTTNLNNNVNANTNSDKGNDVIKTNTKVRDNDTGLLLPNTLEFTVNNDDPVFRVYKFVIPNVFKNDYIRVELSKQVKNRLAIHFISNTDVETEFCRHMCYKFYIKDVTEINLKSAESYSDEEYVYVKFLKYTDNANNKYKNVKVIHTVNPKYHTFYTNCD